MKEADRHIHAVSAALDVLTAFDRDVPLRLKELHERTGQNRSRLLRLLGTLENHGFVSFDPAAATYQLGGVVNRLGALTQDRFSRLDAIVRPVLAKLVADTSDTAFFSGIEGLRRVVTVAEEAQDGLRFTAREGQTRPLHAGASSKVLLAFADPDTAEKAIALVPDAERAALEAELDDIRRDGHAVSRGEVTAYGFAIAVPVRRGAGVHALSLAGVLSKLTPDLIASHLDRLVRDAASIEATLPPIPTAPAVAKPHRRER